MAAGDDDAPEGVVEEMDDVDVGQGSAGDEDALMEGESEPSPQNASVEIKGLNVSALPVTV